MQISTEKNIGQGSRTPVKELGEGLKALKEMANCFLTNKPYAHSNHRHSCRLMPYWLCLRGRNYVMPSLPRLSKTQNLISHPEIQNISFLILFIKEKATNIEFLKLSLAD